jgi:predicted ribonuclease YlaK
LLPNEYVIIYDKTTKEEIDKMCWTGTEYRRLKYGDFTSTYFGNIKPLKGDSYQFLLADSFLTNKLTLVKGRAGSGKTMLSLAFLLH